VAKEKKPKDKKAAPREVAAATTQPTKSREQRAAEKQALAMWALLGAGGEAYGGKLKPEIEKAEREALKRAGLIESEERERRAIWLSVTDKGWDWAEQHLAASLPDKTQSGAFVLRAWLTRLQEFLRVRKLRLAQFITAEPELAQTESDPAPSPDHVELRELIRGAYLEIAGGFNRRALLRDLRAKLDVIERSSLDTALKRMQREEEASLMQLDNRLDITEEDRRAALQIGNEPRHILWITR
jgi:DNA-binding MarR family transcriptional regulator